MCAASVYPEPGSNSLVFGIYIFEVFLLLSYKSFFKLSLNLASFSFLFVFFGSTNNYRLIGLSKDLLFTFQCTFLFPFLTERFVLYYITFYLSTYFLDFFEIFFITFLYLYKISFFTLLFLLFLQSSTVFWAK